MPHVIFFCYSRTAFPNVFRKAIAFWPACLSSAPKICPSCACSMNAWRRRSPYGPTIQYLLKSVRWPPRRRRAPFHRVFHRVCKGVWSVPRWFLAWALRLRCLLSFLWTYPVPRRAVRSLLLRFSRVSFLGPFVLVVPGARARRCLCGYFAGGFYVRVGSIWLGCGFAPSDVTHFSF